MNVLSMEKSHQKEVNYLTEKQLVIIHFCICLVPEYKQFHLCGSRTLINAERPLQGLPLCYTGLSNVSSTSNSNSHFWSAKIRPHFSFKGKGLKLKTYGNLTKPEKAESFLLNLQNKVKSLHIQSVGASPLYSPRSPLMNSEQVNT